MEYVGVDDSVGPGCVVEDTDASNYTDFTFPEYFCMIPVQML